MKNGKGKVIKKVLKHLKEDTKEFKKGIQSDKKLTKSLQSKNR